MCSRSESKPHSFRVEYTHMYMQVDFPLRCYAAPEGTVATGMSAPPVEQWILSESTVLFPKSRPPPLKTSLHFKRCLDFSVARLAWSKPNLLFGCISWLYFCYSWPVLAYFQPHLCFFCVHKIVSAMKRMKYAYALRELKYWQMFTNRSRFSSSTTASAHTLKLTTDRMLARIKQII